ncbi:LysR family transcriptional regulator [Methylocystis suflitae]|uniref:LysR family transcriptional regulator n=1 Tax=Methylocystis suflitae TaxID=2951405 RepID=UPI00210C316D|nr:LysR family transcriptional regulator [Methylocystis suflitae]MCQ4188337.1 LysR family transcriptional regulator [Methylocystis suflitae]
MHETNLSGVDLNLLPPLDALLRRRNVTRAAEDVGLSQPAMSRALARLRGLLGDPLLVRTREGFALTPKAQTLAPQVVAALDGLKPVFAPTRFDPAKERRVLRVAAADVQSILLGPPIMSRLSREAPLVDLRFEPYGGDVLRRLESGALDLAFALATTPLPPGAVSETVACDELALIRAEVIGRRSAGGNSRITVVSIMSALRCSAMARPRSTPCSRRQAYPAA